MNQPDSCLDRLFRAAARAPRPLPNEAPFYLEGALVNWWCTEASQEMDTPAMMPVVRRAFVFACGILAVSAAFIIYSLNDGPPSELVVVDSVIQLTLSQ